MTPDPITVVSAGGPSSQFMGAAGRWNRASFGELDAHGAPTGAAHDTVDLPLTTVDGGTAAATDMNAICAGAQCGQRAVHHPEACDDGARGQWDL